MKLFISRLRLIINYIISRLWLKVEFLGKLLIRFVWQKTRIVKKYPSTIQLPITYKCNFNCIMCGMNKHINDISISPNELKTILSNKLFKKVQSIGLNGGEPFLRNDLVECVKVMIESLPRLRFINIISNGYFTQAIMDKLPIIYGLAKKNNISVNIAFSIDGIEEMQNHMRGHIKSWKQIVKTIDEINSNKEKYCDSISGICTVTKDNVFNLCEVEEWGKNNNITISYNIATINARIDNNDLYRSFSIFCDDKAQMIAQEFFYKKAVLDKSETYFGLYLYIRDQKRYSYCPCKYNDWVTLLPNGNISYCATFSKELGSGLKESAYDLFNNNIHELNNIVSHKCDNCSHYTSILDIRGLKEFYYELLKNQKILF